MKKIIIVILALFLILPAANGQDLDGVQESNLKLDVGGSFYSPRGKPRGIGGHIDLVYSYAFLDFSLSNRVAILLNQETSLVAHSILGVYYRHSLDFLQPGISVFGGPGIGGAMAFVDGTKIGLSIDAILGTQYAMTQRMAFILKGGYNFARFSEGESVNDFNALTLNLGFRFAFWDTARLKY